MSNNNSQEELENENVRSSVQQDKGVNNFVQKYSKVIILSAVAIIVIVGLVLFIRSNNAKNEANAAKALSRIEKYYLEGSYENALNGNDSLPTVRGEKIVGLVKIVEEYGSTAAGERAALYAADCYFNLKKTSDAKIYYEKILKSDIDVIKTGGLAGTAACNEIDKNYSEAAENYLKAAELIPDDMQKLRYMYFAGLCKEKLGDTEAALKIYRDIVNLNKYGEFNNLAKSGLVRLGTDIE